MCEYYSISNVMKLTVCKKDRTTRVPKWGYHTEILVHIARKQASVIRLFYTEQG